MFLPRVHVCRDFVLLYIQSGNKINATFRCKSHCAKHTHANVNTSRYSPHHKAWYSSKVQATSCGAFRGKFHSPSSHRDTIAIIPQARVPEVSKLLFQLPSKCWQCTRVSHVFLHSYKIKHVGYRATHRHRVSVMYQHAPIPLP